MTDTIYAPRTDITAKIKRRAARYMARDMISPSLDRGIVSLSFDDCPKSVVENALPLIEAEGWSATLYLSMGLCDTTNHLGLHMSEDDVVAAHASGHEIGDHTFSHMDGLQAGPKAMHDDIDRNRTAFDRLGLPRATTFAYPYGEVTPSLKRSLRPKFDLLRGIHAPSQPSLDLGLSAAGRLYSSEIETTLALIETAAREKRWLTLFGHDVRADPSDFGCTPEDLVRIITAIKNHGLAVMSVSDALTTVRT